MCKISWLYFYYFFITSTFCATLTTTINLYQHDHLDYHHHAMSATTMTKNHFHPTDIHYLSITDNCCNYSNPIMLTTPSAIMTNTTTLATSNTSIVPSYNPVCFLQEYWSAGQSSKQMIPQPSSQPLWVQVSSTPPKTNILTSVNLHIKWKSDYWIQYKKCD